MSRTVHSGSSGLLSALCSQLLQLRCPAVIMMLLQLKLSLYVFCSWATAMRTYRVASCQSPYSYCSSCFSAPANG